MTVDTRLEEKLGFDRIRSIISDRCCTDFAADRVASEKFSTDPVVIRHRLLLTDEMRLIVMFEDSFPTTGYIDALPFLKPLLKDGFSIDVLSLGKLRTMLDTSRKISVFFSGIKDDIYPNLQRMASSLSAFPDIVRRIDSIIDKYGEIRDSASDELFSIRKSRTRKRPESPAGLTPSFTRHRRTGSSTVTLPLPSATASSFFR